jgi:hypothetical protein
MELGDIQLGPETASKLLLLNLILWSSVAGKCA